jgi:hypothetical protein
MLVRGRAREVTRDLDTTEKKDIKRLQRPKDWAITIEPALELMCRDARHKFLRVDVSGCCPAPLGGAPGKGHTVTIRVWSDSEAHWLDKDRDHPDLIDKIRARGNGRVIVRVHFDREDEKGGGPWSHLQIGGTSDAYEFYPYPPPGFNVPRFLHPPMDFVLALEFITKTFSRDVYDSIKDEPAWTGPICESQKEYAGAYFERLRKVTDMKRSLLEVCWAFPG